MVFKAEGKKLGNAAHTTHVRQWQCVESANASISVVFSAKLLPDIAPIGENWGLLWDSQLNRDRRTLCLAGEVETGVLVHNSHFLDFNYT